MQKLVLLTLFAAGATILAVNAVRAVWRGRALSWRGEISKAERPASFWRAVITDVMLFVIFVWAAWNAASW